MLEKALPGQQVELAVLAYPEFDAATRDSTCVLAEKLRLALAAPYHLLKESGEEVEYCVTASISLVLFAGAAAPIDIMRRADEAMYAAKHGGRDRVVVEGEV